MKKLFLPVTAATLVALGCGLWLFNSDYDIFPSQPNYKIKPVKFEKKEPLPNEVAPQAGHQKWRSVTVKFSSEESIESDSSQVDLNCESVFAEDGQPTDPIEISEAQNLSLCHKGHYKLTDTSNPRATIKSILAALEQERSNAGEEESHTFEISDLIYMYRHLVSPDEAKELEKISSEKSAVGKMAKILVDELHGVKK